MANFKIDFVSSNDFIGMNTRAAVHLSQHLPAPKPRLEYNSVQKMLEYLLWMDAKDIGKFVHYYEYTCLLRDIHAAKLHMAVQVVWADNMHRI